MSTLLVLPWKRQAMSYCRWSSDHFECDVYVYESSQGWVTHIAGRRRKAKLPDHIKAMFPDNWQAEGAVDKYMAAKEAEKEWIRTLPHEVVMGNDTSGNPVPMYFLADSEYDFLPAPMAGETVTSDSPGECAAFIESLRPLGFNVPQYAIDALREEQAEMDSSPVQGADPHG